MYDVKNKFEKRVNRYPLIQRSFLTESL